MFTELKYVPLHKSSFHQDCQSTFIKWKELLCAKESVELRVLPAILQFPYNSSQGWVSVGQNRLYPQREIS